MADARLVPRSVGKVMGALALVGALAGSSALFVWGCTNTESTTFKEPNRPFDAGTGGTTTDAGDGGMDAQKTTDAAADHEKSNADGSNADSLADH